MMFTARRTSPFSNGGVLDFFVLVSAIMAELTRRIEPAYLDDSSSILRCHILKNLDEVAEAEIADFPAIAFLHAL